MICFFPYTHISDPRVKLLADVMGPVTVCLPVDSMRSFGMKAWVQQGTMETRTPAGLDGSALMAAVRDFKDWAGIHGTKLSDISDFYRRSQGRPPLVDENGPSRILTQIKHRESGDAAEEPDRLFQSALFLALAHEHDMHQDEADRQLGSVAAMEAELYANISGDTEDVALRSTLRTNAAAAAIHQEHGDRMSTQRLQAWACLAQSCSPIDSVYVTTSSDVLDHVLERYPHHTQPISWELSDSDRAMALKPQRLKALEDFGRSSNPSAEFPDDSLTGEQGAVRLTLHFLVGVAPQHLLVGLSKTPMKTHDHHENVWLNSIVGLIESCRTKKSVNKA
jgi:hypothetical protein